MAVLTRDQILSASDLTIQRFDVPEWGGEVCLKVMTVGERDEYENDWAKSRLTGMHNFRSRFLVRCICDEQGNRLFSDDEAEELANKSAAAMARLWDEAMTLNKLKEKDVEELAKN